MRDAEPVDVDEAFVGSVPERLDHGGPLIRTLDTPRVGIDRVELGAAVPADDRLASGHDSIVGSGQHWSNMTCRDRPQRSGQSSRPGATSRCGTLRPVEELSPQDGPGPPPRIEGCHGPWIRGRVLRLQVQRARGSRERQEDAGGADIVEA